jgi:hypothetical protein
MTLKSFTETLILLWPVVILLALFATLLTPDRFLRKRADGARKADILQVSLKVAAGLWFLFIAMAQSIPHKGDIGKAPFWPQVLEVLSPVVSAFTAPLAVLGLAAYGVAGLVWSIVYFWLYARRLGQRYVMERDLWMRAHHLTSLEAVTEEQRTDFRAVVIDKVKSGMFYDGDFPLRPLQQKRFFAAHLTLWPATLLAYALGDLALDIARQIWFALRAWIRRVWEAGMAEYLADDKLCQAYLAKPTP